MIPGWFTPECCFQLGHNLDLRYGRETQLGGIVAILGATVNNNPTVTDPYNSTPAWAFLMPRRPWR
nr:hypothetical protein [uncultured Rhodopila sp.]